ncbi:MULTISPECIES: hypothetical protein [Variovorax]|jgi:hypothetical protein|uniref:hypothetical protein n=1 Tax=Variovorax TaxID=34072 RepID=UPI00086F1E89|nr:MULTISPECIES: hypothetical protein [Variovorax]MBN8758321.1 hypothetical protein [Variovorax sp.]ODU12661.1 MAG: hypothetical protein ABS94_29795 [Variovorax sp. SCN 67-85]ODV19246.1 MAG: hypothetical protein ABT25_26685 [Variovorax sp. SCN 67-20]OJZ06557.1 MAG: hypothetical protein BGP22_31015 [Variovorax sp. 67-131]UKI07641.1 hypothetical protein L3V85_33400 [Variovorax paradoxus]
MAASVRAPAHVCVESLALKACDDVDSFHAVHLAYACLEKLIVPQRVSDPEEIYPTRTELGALMRLVNEELQRRIETVEATVQSWRVAVAEGGDGVRVGSS